MSARILIVEDEKSIADGLAFNLRKEGYEPILAQSGEEALDLFHQASPDLVLLDLMLPDMDGLTVCRAMRRDSAAPILMLTARSREMDKVVGLETGADDYIAKPFGIQELLARVKAALRRAHGAGVVPTGPLIAGDITLDPGTRVVEVRGQRVALRPKEFDLLRAFMKHPGRVLRREDLFEQVWGDVEYIERGTLDVHIRWLREKIEEHPSRPVHIVTVRSVGYKFAP